MPFRQSPQVGNIGGRSTAWPPAAALEGTKKSADPPLTFVSRRPPHPSWHQLEPIISLASVYKRPRITGNKGDYFPLDGAHALLSAVGNGLTIIANRGIIDEKEGPTHGNHEYRFTGIDEALCAGTVTEGGYSSVSEYMRELIRADQKRKVEERIDTLLLEGLDSGQPIPVTAEYWEEKKRRLTERLSKATKPQ